MRLLCQSGRHCAGSLCLMTINLCQLIQTLASKSISSVQNLKSLCCKWPTSGREALSTFKTFSSKGANWCQLQCWASSPSLGMMTSASRNLPSSCHILSDTVSLGSWLHAFSPAHHMRNCRMCPMSATSHKSFLRAAKLHCNGVMNVATEHEHHATRFQRV